MKLKRDIWKMAGKGWGAEVERNGVGVGIRNVSLARAIWHVLVVRRPDEFGSLLSSEKRTNRAPGGE
jgi:hypothetical protein